MITLGKKLKFKRNQPSVTFVMSKKLMSFYFSRQPFTNNYEKKKQSNNLRFTVPG